MRSCLSRLPAGRTTQQAIGAGHRRVRVRHWVAAEQRKAAMKLLAAAFFLVSFFFVHRSFYGMRIQPSELKEKESAHAATESAR